MCGIKRVLLTWTVVFPMLLNASQAIAQNHPSSSRHSPTNSEEGWRQERNTYDPAKYRQQAMDRYRERLEVTDETEWRAIQPLIENILEARTAFKAARRAVLTAGGESRGAEKEAEPAQRGTRGVSNPAAEALHNAVHSKAPAREVKAALARYLDYRKSKQADLERPQEALRAVLTSRQEAIAVIIDLL